MHPVNVAVVLFHDVELLDFAGPLEVFSVADDQASQAAFRVFTVAQDNDVTTARACLTVNSHFQFADCPRADILVIPGGIGSRAVIESETLLEQIKVLANQATLICSVCTGALILARLGMLDGRRATTHAVGFELLQDLAPTATICRGARFVDEGNVVTSAGISAGIDMSLHIVGRYFGEELAASTARHMEYVSGSQR